VRLRPLVLSALLSCQPLLPANAQASVQGIPGPDELSAGLPAVALTAFGSGAPLELLGPHDLAFGDRVGCEAPGRTLRLRRQGDLVDAVSMESPFLVMIEPSADRLSVSLLEGAILVEDSSTTVRVGDTVIGSTGTRYLVSRENGRVQCVVFSGSVMVNARTRWSVSAGSKWSLEGATPQVQRLEQADVVRASAIYARVATDALPAGLPPAARTDYTQKVQGQYEQVLLNPDRPDLQMQLIGTKLQHGSDYGVAHDVQEVKQNPKVRDAASNGTAPWPGEKLLTTYEFLLQAERGDDEAATELLGRQGDSIRPTYERIVTRKGLPESWRGNADRTFEKDAAERETARVERLSLTRPDEARAAADRLVEAHPRSGATALTRARVLVASGDQTEAGEAALAGLLAKDDRLSGPQADAAWRIVVESYGPLLFGVSRGGAAQNLVRSGQYAAAAEALGAPTASDPAALAGVALLHRLAGNEEASKKLVAEALSDRSALQAADPRVVQVLEAMGQHP